ncbi:unnamed protein product [Rangifer tarandus platyrhynchus]|uniref:Uncharacterized protein n=2 Tax=Rangifer tarandus platyrhynchus TaxID=3082113 RepID=A0AC59YL36_RANTA|nr:unnamed protein product [Rangifer tarandus platyrhynchus]
MGSGAQEKGLAFDGHRHCSVTQSCLTLRPYGLQRQASLSFTISQSLLKLTSVESVMPSKHLIPCHTLLLLPSVFLSILCHKWGIFVVQLFPGWKAEPVIYVLREAWV